MILVSRFRTKCKFKFPSYQIFLIAGESIGNPHKQYTSAKEIISPFQYKFNLDFVIRTKYERKIFS